MKQIMAPVGHPTMKLMDISPSVSPSFSPNLYRWMKTEGHAYSDCGVAETAYRILPGSKLAELYGAGTLMIGCPYNQYEGDTDFSGTLLMAVLCNGSNAKRYCYPGAINALEAVEGFWDRYMQIGRCAIDPSHQEHFRGSARYSFAGNVRTCLWCGQQHTEIEAPKKQ